MSGETKIDEDARSKNNSLRSDIHTLNDMGEVRLQGFEVAGILTALKISLSVQTKLATILFSHIAEVPIEDDKLGQYVESLKKANNMLNKLIASIATQESSDEPE